MPHWSSQNKDIDLRINQHIPELPINHIQVLGCLIGFVKLLSQQQWRPESSGSLYSFNFLIGKLVLSSWERFILLINNWVTDHWNQSA
jgi:hypothetical protein